jgi:glycosyltransferase involved in cell wall biosynthesis
MSKPFFSIVLPTRNRADLLVFAVRSVLNQTFGNYELIISDNLSVDETSAVAQSFGDERIKYFRSEKSLSMGDNYELALSHAKGEFVTFLSDDDAYAKIFLERMHGIINKENADIVNCNFAHYYGVDTHEYGKKIDKQTLVVHPFDRKLHVLNKKEAVTALFAHDRLTSEASEYQSFVFPRLVNAAYHCSLIEKLSERLPKIFPILSSDIYTSPLFLNTARKYCFIDEPLYLHQQWTGSATSGEQSIFQKYPEESVLDYVPLKKLLSLPNYITNATLRAKFDWGEDFQEVPLDWSYYFISSYQELKYMQVNKIDVSEQLKEFEQVLSAQDEKLQKQVRSKMSSYNTLTRLVRSKLKDSVIGDTLLKLKHQKIKFFDGFNNIAECAEIVDEIFLQENINK